ATGLSSTEGLMTTAAGRTTVEYMVRCALPANTSITKQDQNGVSYTFKGSLGFAPEWATGECNTTCQENVSACLIAPGNSSGIHVPLVVVSQAPRIRWGMGGHYPHQEGSFFG